MATLHVTVLEATDLAGPVPPSSSKLFKDELLPAGLRHKMRRPPPQLEVAVHLSLQLGRTVWRTSDIVVPGLPARGGVVGEDFVFAVSSAHESLDMTCLCRGQQHQPQQPPALPPATQQKQQQRLQQQQQQQQEQQQQRSVAGMSATSFMRSVSLGNSGTGTSGGFSSVRGSTLGGIMASIGGASSSSSSSSSNSGGGGGGDGGGGGGATAAAMAAARNKAVRSIGTYAKDVTVDADCWVAVCSDAVSVAPTFFTPSIIRMVLHSCLYMYSFIHSFIHPFVHSFVSRVALFVSSNLPSH